MAEQSVPDSVPAETLAAARETFWVFAEPPYAKFDEQARARIENAFKYAAAELVAAGRAQAAADIRAYADKIQGEWPSPLTGVTLAAVADQCAKIAEEAP
ncbi:hypothetical protein K1W54_29850 [Micromonospora sp. CPCC 205371]|nr:hypothetical protein [Micromonospora sp. CPCC 205371]